MVELAFEWEAEYEDKTNIKQFEDGKETLYGDIDFDQVTEFSLKGENGKFKIVLNKGEIWANGEKLIEGCKGDPVYFRRTRVIGVDNGLILQENIVFHLGIGDKKIMISKDGSYKKEGF